MHTAKVSTEVYVPDSFAVLALLEGEGSGRAVLELLRRRG